MGGSRRAEWQDLARRRRWTASEAQAVLAAASKSGVALGEFARRHGLQGQRLYRWTRRLAGRSEPALARMSEPRRVDFVELAMEQVAAERRSGAVERMFEIELRSGRRVRVGAAFDEEALRRLVRLLEAMPAAC